MRKFIAEKPITRPGQPVTVVGVIEDGHFIEVEPWAGESLVPVARDVDGDWWVTFPNHRGYEMVGQPE